MITLLPSFVVSIFSSNGLPFKARVSILEERLSAYDELSKQMLSKLELAVEKISESNSNISQILIRHEERIDRASEVNESVAEEIDRTNKSLNDEISKTEKRLQDQINTNTDDIDDLKKNRFLFAGIVIATSFFLSQLNIFEGFRYVPDQEHHKNNAEYIRSF